MDALGQTQQHEDLSRRRVLPFSTNQKVFFRTEQGLKPNTNYAVSVRSVYRRSADLAADVTRVVNTSCQTLPQPPRRVPEPKPITRELHPNVRIGLDVQRASERYGPISTYLVVVAPLSVMRRSSMKRMSNAELSAAAMAARPGDERPWIAKAITPADLFSESRRVARVTVGGGGKSRTLTRGIDYVAFLRACVRTLEKEECRDSPWSSAFGSQRTPMGESTQNKRGRKMQTVLFASAAVVVIIFLLVCVAVWCFFR